MNTTASAQQYADLINFCISATKAGAKYTVDFVDFDKNIVKYTVFMPVELDCDENTVLQYAANNPNPKGLCLYAGKKLDVKLFDVWRVYIILGDSGE